MNSSCRTLALAVGLLVCAALPVAAADSSLPLKAVGETMIPIPPPEHPRLYLRTADAAVLAQRLKNPVLQSAVERLEKLAAKSAQFRVEWQAVQQLAKPDAGRARAIIQDTLTLLKQSVLPDRNDACRVTGRMMVTGALVYDWLYASLTADEKQTFITELVRLAKTQECGYPPTRQGSVTGHSSEAMIMRDMLSAGIAIYDEFPEMYDLSAGRFFKEHLPVRNWLYNGHAYHQGDSYGPYRFGADTFPLFIFDRMGAGNVYNPEQRFVPYLWLYTTRPDGQRLRSGDTFSDSALRGKPWSEGHGTLLTASYYHDGVLLSEFLKQGGAAENEALFEFLWRDTTLKPAPIESLPLARYFGSPFGWMVARTGWGEDAVVAEMKVNEYNFVNHQHLDAGAFQIYYRGALAIDSGVYSGSSGQYGSPHGKNYSWRTIAHNSLLVFDPDERFSSNVDWGNDGGQRLPNGRSEARNMEALLAPEKGYRTGRVIAHGFGPDAKNPAFTLLQGDITDAYSKKVRQVTRSWVFLNLGNEKVPAAMVLFDRVISSNPAFKKTWLMHTLEEPRIMGSSATMDRTEHGAHGRLNLDVLLPTSDNAVLTKVGGPGKEFWVFGTNYANDIDPSRLARGSMEPGAWRLELTPKTSAVADEFLTVMQVTDSQTGTRLMVQRVDAADRVGCVLKRADENFLVLFRQDTLRSAQPVRFTVPGAGRSRCLITDLAPGRWQARSVADKKTTSIEVSAESGTAWLEGPTGEWVLDLVPPN